MRYDDPLDYELDCYLGRLQYLMWRTQDDSAMVLTRLVALAKSGIDGKLEAGLEPPTKVPTPEPIACPLASVDPRLRRRQPGGAIQGE